MSKTLAMLSFLVDAEKVQNKQLLFPEELKGALQFFISFDQKDALDPMKMVGFGNQVAFAMFNGLMAEQMEKKEKPRIITPNLIRPN